MSKPPLINRLWVLSRIPYMYKFLRYVDVKDVKNRAFSVLLVWITASTSNFVDLWVFLSSVLHNWNAYVQSRNLYLWCIKIAPGHITIYYWAHTTRLKSVVSLNEVVTIFEATLPTGCAAGRDETCLHPLQVLSVAIHVYPAIQLMQAKVLPMKF